MDILQHLASELDLPAELYKRAENIYHDVAEILHRNLSDFHPDIFLQGSFKLGTVIQPISDDEQHDLDFVCLFNQTDRIESPLHLKRLLGDALKKEYGTDVLEEKVRCWRLNFDRFHVDILPAIPEDNPGAVYEAIADNELIFQPIKIPEKGLKNYKSSNPGGYFKWFEQQKLKGSGDRIFLAEKSTEEVPDQHDKTTLQRVIQLLKRHRDVMFSEQPDLKPISIIITTLAADIYTGQQDLLSAMKHISANMPDRISQKAIYNPANPRENFADKWSDEPQKQKSFNEWLVAVNEMADQLERVVESPTYGIANVKKILAENYGENITESAFDGFNNSVEDLRSRGHLGVTGTGVIGGSAAGSKNVKANTFYGD